MWEYLPKNKWNGGVAADMYLKIVRRGLQRAYPERKYFNVLEDNDPSEFKSNKASGCTSQANSADSSSSQTFRPITSKCMTENHPNQHASAEREASYAPGSHSIDRPT